MAQSRTRSTLYILVVLGLCIFCYILGSWHRSAIGRGDYIASIITKETECNFPLTLNFETHHAKPIFSNQTLNSSLRLFEPCDEKYTDYTPCQDQRRAMSFPRKNMVYRERHCPTEKEKMYCLVPAPKGYEQPFHWPKSRDYVPFVNMPYKNLTVEKAGQNWIHFEGNVFRFPGGGTQFPQGADRYIDQIASVVPIENGTVRTVLDTGCGVASFGAYLLSRNVLTMSFAPRDSHTAQVQFALERGVPAVIGVLGSMKLPYPSRSFDMAHCSRCLVPWTSSDGMYMMEIDRVLRPGGYWVLSGPPINWKHHYNWWKHTKVDLETEQRKIEELAELLCWEKISEIAETAIWRKPINLQSCPSRKYGSHIKTCDSTKMDNVWYQEMEVCITPYPTVEPIQLEPFPKRLYAVPPRISTGTVPKLSPDLYSQDNKLWRRHVVSYKRVNKFLGTDRYRNVMDMNAGLGGFGAALESDKVWVMNVMPTVVDLDTLGVIYERGMIGIYHDWCEAFSTYPRTYDLIHANGIFSLYENRCKTEDILLEMDRILRPEGAVIIRENIDILSKVGNIAIGMRWDIKLVDHEDGPHLSEKVMFGVKKYWVGGSRNTKNNKIKTD
ncbi:hypothetical protein LUZ63_008052 [Rhynchospora breviuscula]|uniref:Methyltransferase n=1 Tax=Rhynchospora breviuscula TaxID=2022672 RepID=A0A9Q0HVL9_9POAL|nr:hypothetical protein LUZ63_008052 [Rhynchospora breviuscula]